MIIILTDIKMSDDASDTLATEDKTEITKMPSSNSSAEEAGEHSDSAVTASEPMLADPGDSLDNAATEGAELADSMHAKQLKDPGAMEPPYNGEEPEDALVECIDSVSLETEPGSEIPLKEQNSPVGVVHSCPFNLILSNIYIHSFIPSIEGGDVVLEYINITAAIHMCCMVRRLVESN